MAGIYIHIPFCRQACHYCDFHFSTNLKNQDLMINAICDELISRSGYLNEDIATIYFGGGTPSLLNSDQTKKLLQTIEKNFSILPFSEITFEANPEDLTLNKLKVLKKLGINRLSIGIQTFRNEELNWMNRIHDSKQAERAFLNARNAGFKNISLDFIYALPNYSNSFWELDLSKAVEMEPEHISLYGLTIEERTVFGKRRNKNKLKELPEEEAAEQYLHAISFLNLSGYNHYEVSNFAKPGFYSRHNLAYWSGQNYLGVGPGAHSFNGRTRQLNIRNNPKYLKAWIKKSTFFQIEELSEIQLLNETILTRLRRESGISFKEVNEKYNVDLKRIYHGILTKLHQQKLAIYSEDSLRLTSHGFLVADEIALQLFFQE
ncbi:MAG: radical SAM family heme chaperone HemW [Bacteroidota bacterium]